MVEYGVNEEEPQVIIEPGPGHYHKDLSWINEQKGKKIVPI